jgi:hypothetical protein
MYFWNLNENKKLKTRHIVLGLNLAQGLAVLAQPNGYFGMADPSRLRAAHARWHDWRGLVSRQGVTPTLARAPVGQGLYAGHAPSGGTLPIRCGDDEAAGSIGSATSHGGDEVPRTTMALQGLLQHRRGEGWMRRVPVGEEKATQVELTEEGNVG